MPGPLFLPLLQAGTLLAGQGFNAASQGSMNKKTRQHQEYMYGMQRRDSLADWTMQNDYNSPQSQMQRLREAGLNPNLVYGNGTTSPSVNVRGADAQSWNPRAPQLDMGGAVTSGMSAYYDTEVKKAQIDNLKVQNTVSTQEALLKAAQVISTTATGKSTEFDNQMKSELKQVSLDAAKASLTKLQVDTTSTLDANERANAMQSSSLQMAAENILTARANRTTNAAQREHILSQIESIKKDVRIKQLDIELKQTGVQPTDALWQRVLVRLINSGHLTGGQLGTMIEKGFKKFLP